MATSKYIGPASTWYGLPYEITRGDNDSVVVELNGSFAQCQAAQPAKGATLRAFPDFTVAHSRCVRRAGGRGVLTITLQGKVRDPDNDAVVTRKVNLEWRQTERALVASTHLDVGSSVRVAALDAWRVEPDVDLKHAFKWNNPTLYGGGGIYSVVYEEMTLNTAEQALAQRILAGQEGYWFWYPVVDVLEVRMREPRAVKPPVIVSGATLAAATGRRKYVPQEDSQSNLYDYMLVGMNVSDDGGLWTTRAQWIGGLPPSGVLGLAYSSQAFDPIFYGTRGKRVPAA